MSLVYRCIIVSLLLLSACKSATKSEADELISFKIYTTSTKSLLVSTEAIFQRTSYSRHGGFVNQTGYYIYRISIRDLMSGKLLRRSKLKDKTFIVGVFNDLVWVYDYKNGLHNRSLVDLELYQSQEDWMQKAKQNIQFSKDYGSESALGLDTTHTHLAITDVRGREFTLNPHTLTLKPTTENNRITYGDASASYARVNDSTELSFDTGKQQHILLNVHNNERIRRMRNSLKRITRVAIAKAKDSLNRQLSVQNGLYTDKNLAIKQLVNLEVYRVDITNKPVNVFESYLNARFLIDPKKYDLKKHEDHVLSDSKQIFIVSKQRLENAAPLLLTELTTKTFKRSWQLSLPFITDATQIKWAELLGTNLILLTESHCASIDIEHGKLRWVNHF